MWQEHFMVGNPWPGKTGRLKETIGTSGSVVTFKLPLGYEPHRIHAIKQDDRMGPFHATLRPSKFLRADYPLVRI